MTLTRGVLRGAMLFLAIAVIAMSGSRAQGAVSDKGSDNAAMVKEAAFYKGKILVLVVPYGPGGGYDAYARMIAPFIEKNTGSTVIIQNVPGGGTIVGTLQMYRARPDGLTMSIVQLSALVVRTILGENMGFDMNKVNWLARVASENRLVTAGVKSPYRTLDEIKKSTRPVKFSAAGVLSSDFNHLALFSEALGLNIKLITAYEGSSEQDLAVIRGDVDGTIGSYTSKQKFIKSGDMIPIVQFAAARHKEMPTIPLGTELPNLTPSGKSLLTFINHQAIFDRVFAAPPGIPANRLKFLKTAVIKALSDPELQAIGEKQKRPLDPADAAAVTQSVKQDLQMPAQLIELIKKTLKSYKG
ncbi:MAG: hypothetical protein HY742_01300 [Deltaproteobacteria bacterium]|nr:hypothetical protein [Deltaproteobacteria bacterium]